MGLGSVSDVRPRRVGPFSGRTGCSLRRFLPGCVSYPSQEAAVVDVRPASPDCVARGCPPAVYTADWRCGGQQADDRPPSSSILDGGVMARQPRAVDATLVVRVPVNAAGSLVDGAVRTVERIDAVDRVERPEICGLEPGLNDTTVDLHARVRLVGDRGEDLAVVRRTLEAAVGVHAVDDLEAAASDDPHREVRVA